MSQVQGLTTWQPSAHASWNDAQAEMAGPSIYAGSSLPLLIQVPSVRVARLARRPSARAIERITVCGADAVAPRRRRLRRKVRLTGCVLMMVAPLALAATLLHALPTATASDTDRSNIAARRPPAVFLSIEAPGRESEPPVVFPGYLLPDDGNEEPAHAGG